MDLSGLKWPVIIAVIVGIGWLMTSGGVNWMVGQYTKAQVGADVQRDLRDEAGLSSISKYLITMFRYEKCAAVLELSLNRYGPGAPNYYNNISRLSTCYEKMRRYQDAVDLIQKLIDEEAFNVDDRIPNRDALALRAAKLREVHGL